MNNDCGIICFKHCNNKNIYCIDIPTSCPICKIYLQNPLSIPIRIPYPFVRASQQPCSVVVKPTEGSFLDDYQLMDDLHIGVTTSRGTVISYNWNGITVDTNNWQGCLNVFCFKEHSLETEWDAILTDLVKKDCWDSARYNEEQHNCFSFVMAFIKQLNEIQPSTRRVETREDFTERHIVPATMKAFKYIHLYREIIEKGFYVYNQSSNEILCT